MKQILLIEDENSVVTFIKTGLSEEGFDVSVALNGNTGLQMALAFKYDLIILDIMLPDKSGLEVCREIRTHKTETPILFLTALGAAENIAFGLNAGADDYLVKPFKFIELHARINALMRRNNPGGAIAVADPRSVYTIADLVVDDEAKNVKRNGVEISLTATEYRLLLVLIRNKGKVLSRVDLLENAWDINFNMGTNVVDVYVNYLRKKVDADHSNKLIQTVIGMGYVLKEKM